MWNTTKLDEVTDDKVLIVTFLKNGIRKYLTVYKNCFGKFETALGETSIDMTKKKIDAWIYINNIPFEEYKEETHESTTIRDEWVSARNEVNNLVKKVEDDFITKLRAHIKRSPKDVFYFVTNDPETIRRVCSEQNLKFRTGDNKKFVIEP